MLTVLKTHSLAFFDCFAGLIPCKVSSIRGHSGDASTAQRVTVVLTATRGAYHAGETVESFGLHIVPRAAVVRRGAHQIILPYTVETN